MTITEVQDDLPERIAAASAASRDADAEALLLKQARNRLLVAAVNAGHSQRTVARWAGLKGVGTLCRILGSPQDDEDGQ